jgi:anti-sigma factor RsiW
MILITVQDQHIDGGDLIRLLDAECEGEEDRLLRRHLAACTECKRRYDRRARLSERFSLALMDLEESLPVRVAEPHRRPGPHPWLARLRSWWSRKTVRVLAIATVILALGGAVTPVRAWVVAGFQTLKSLIGIEPGVTPASQQDAPVVHFAVFGDEFLIEFTTSQSSGTLSLAVDTVALASARILGDRGQDELSVLRSGLRVDNAAQSSASYEVTIPHTCRLLEVRIAGRVVARHEVSLGAGWVIDLGAAGPR